MLSIYVCLGLYFLLFARLVLSICTRLGSCSFAQLLVCVRVFVQMCVLIVVLVLVSGLLARLIYPLTHLPTYPPWLSTDRLEPACRGAFSAAKGCSALLHLSRIRR